MSLQHDVPALPLTDGVTIPQLGLGVFQIPDAQVQDVVETAVAAGYRHIDTAELYGNESGIGAALAAIGLPRREMFVTSKVWNNHHRRDDVLRAFDASLSRLRLEVLDLYLIHWPVPSADRYVEAWRTLLELRDAGRVRAVGVSNFQPAQLQRLIEETGQAPSINQVELHPGLQQRELVGFHAAHSIRTESWSPLRRAQGLLTDPVVVQIASRHGVSPAQAVLRWHIEQGYVVIPRSVTPARIVENIDVWSFRLTDDDMAQLAALDRGDRIGPDPDTFAGGATDPT
jgi:2,5-diketo-D-gluconate reductase A